ncbi:hypothetical protein FACS1894133_7010 [Clostridia bacterium]|nr:hypothetical protein FACS1894133_7010 [Clostridia bacterium]
MDKIVDFFRDRRVELAFSFLTPIYAVLTGALAWLTFGFYLRPGNAPCMFLLYLLLNILFCGAMIYSRRMLPTKFFAIFPYAAVLVMIVFAFGNWWLIVPAGVTSAVAFFAAKNAEGIKIILGTFYLIFTVVAVVGTMALNLLSINFIQADEHPVILSNRVTNYAYDSKGRYRIVRYFDGSSREYTDTSYFLEDGSKDVKVPFGTFERWGGCRWLKSVKNQVGKDVVYWETKSKLMVDGEELPQSKWK